ncbi:zinc finger BED domain-containing protein 5-like [Palaemon carinicauda]|uniref:zinc finger BED domain-containing protein 5-like n=1 Tax=Palaemon carinicauda TaxID=392227 RepID=UPI0035B615C4
MTPSNTRSITNRGCGSSAMSRKQMYKEEFLGTGFTCLIDHGVEKPQFVVCGEVLSHDSLKENKLKRHLQGKYPTLAGKYQMSGDIKEQVVAAIKDSGKFSLQLDESTNVSDDVQLLVYVRYQGKSDIEENFLFCKRLETTITGEYLFKLVDSFIKEEGLRWDQCSSVCSDGAPAMLGARRGFTARMCSDMGSEHAHLLYYSSVRWLSRGKVLQRVFDMHAEVEIFLNEKKHALASRLTEPSVRKAQGFKAKLRLWKGKIERENCVLSTLEHFFLEDEDASLLDIKSVIVGHLKKLSEEFDRYIPDGELHEKYRGVRSPFDVHAEDLSKEESSIRNLQEELIEVQHDETLHFNFQRQLLGVFWTAVKKEKPVLGGDAGKVSLPFATTYLCESEFAALTALTIKTSGVRSWLEVHDWGHLKKNVRNH